MMAILITADKCDFSGSKKLSSGKLNVDDAKAISNRIKRDSDNLAESIREAFELGITVEFELMELTSLSGQTTFIPCNLSVLISPDKLD